MPSREWQFRLQDILECTHRVAKYTSGMTYETFRVNQLVIDPVVRNLEVIGEAPVTSRRKFKNGSPNSLGLR